jgi:tetratricopeptide (TPR) repeat protein
VTDQSNNSDEDFLFEMGILLRDQGDYEGACRTFSQFIQNYPDDFAGYLLKGSILLYKMNLVDEALICFEKAVELNPKSELASVALFHCLWEKGRTDDAFEEAKRYILVAGRSEEYGRILDDMAEEFGWRDKKFDDYEE